jgi:hypothetical protein
MRFFMFTALAVAFLATGCVRKPGDPAVAPPSPAAPVTPANPEKAYQLEGKVSLLMSILLPSAHAMVSAEPTPQPSATPTPEATPSPSPTPADASPSPTPEPSATPAPEATPSPSPAPDAPVTLGQFDGKAICPQGSEKCAALIQMSVSGVLVTSERDAVVIQIVAVDAETKKFKFGLDQPLASTEIYKILIFKTDGVVSFRADNTARGARELVILGGEANDASGKDTANPLTVDPSSTIASGLKLSTLKSHLGESIESLKEAYKALDQSVKDVLEKLKAHLTPDPSAPAGEDVLVNLYEHLSDSDVVRSQALNAIEKRAKSDGQNDQNCEDLAAQMGVLKKNDDLVKRGKIGDGDINEDGLLDSDKLDQIAGDMSAEEQNGLLDSLVQKSLTLRTQWGEKAVAMSQTDAELAVTADQMSGPPCIMMMGPIPMCMPGMPGMGMPTPEAMEAQKKLLQLRNDGAQMVQENLRKLRRLAQLIGVLVSHMDSPTDVKVYADHPEYQDLVSSAQATAPILAEGANARVYYTRDMSGD